MYRPSGINQNTAFQSKYCFFLGGGGLLQMVTTTAAAISSIGYQQVPNPIKSSCRLLIHFMTCLNIKHNFLLRIS